MHLSSSAFPGNTEVQQRYHLITHPSYATDCLYDPTSTQGHVVAPQRQLQEIAQNKPPILKRKISSATSFRKTKSRKTISSNEISMRTLLFRETSYQLCLQVFSTYSIKAEASEPLIVQIIKYRLMQRLVKCTMFICPSIKELSDPFVKPPENSEQFKYADWASFLHDMEQNFYDRILMSFCETSAHAVAVTRRNFEQNAIRVNNVQHFIAYPFANINATIDNAKAFIQFFIDNCHTLLLTNPRTCMIRSNKKNAMLLAEDAAPLQQREYVADDQLNPVLFCDHRYTQAEYYYPHPHDMNFQ